MPKKEMGTSSTACLLVIRCKESFSSSTEYTVLIGVMALKARRFGFTASCSMYIILPYLLHVNGIEWKAEMDFGKNLAQ